MLKRLLSVLIITAAFVLPVSQMIKASCGPGSDDTDNTIIVSPSDGTCTSTVSGGIKGSALPDPMTNTITNNGTIDTSGTAGAYGIFGGNIKASGSGTLINNITNNSFVTIGDGAIAIDGGENHGITGNVINTITIGAGSDIEMGSGSTAAFGGDNQTIDGNGTVTNTINVAGTINGGDGDTVADGGSNYDNNGTVTNSVTFTGTATLGNNSIGLGSSNNQGTGTLTNNYTNSGTLNLGTGSQGIVGGNNNGGGTMQNNITNNGAINAGAGSTGIYGGDNKGSGNLTNTIVVNGPVNTDGSTTGIEAGNNGGTGNQTNIVILGNAPVDGNIDGGVAYGGGTISRTLVFNQTISDEGEWDTLKGELASLAPSSGSVTINGNTYTYTNFDELINELILSLKITWFDPGDGRVDPKAGDHIAAYCNINEGTVGVYLINGSSVGQGLTSFAITDLRAAGKAGLFHNLGSMGIISLSVDGQNNFWLAWNGGPLNANGQRDFAKAFSCAFQ